MKILPTRAIIPTLGCLAHCLTNPAPTDLQTPLEHLRESAEPRVQLATAARAAAGRPDPDHSALPRNLCRCYLNARIDGDATPTRVSNRVFSRAATDRAAVAGPMAVIISCTTTPVAWCLQHNGSALAVTDPAPAAFRSALEQLRESVELRKNLANRAQAAAPAFAGPPLRAQLRQLLTTTNV